MIQYLIKIIGENEIFWALWHYVREKKGEGRGAEWICNTSTEYWPLDNDRIARLIWVASVYHRKTHHIASNSWTNIPCNYNEAGRIILEYFLILWLCSHPFSELCLCDEHLPINERGCSSYAHVGTYSQTIWTAQLCLSLEKKNLKRCHEP